MSAMGNTIDELDELVAEQARRIKELEAQVNRECVESMGASTTIKLNIDGNSVEVNCGFIKAADNNVVALSVDLYQRAEIFADGKYDGIPFISIRPVNNKDALPATIIDFVDYVGWIVWCAEVSKTTLAVCLIKEQK